MERQDSLPDKPIRSQFESDEAFEEARGRWQETVGRIRGLVDRSLDGGVLADSAVWHPSPAQLAQHRAQVKEALQQQAYEPSDAELAEMAALLRQVEGNDDDDRQ